MKVAIPQVDSDQCCSRTIRRRSHTLGEYRVIIGGSCSDVLIAHEVKSLEREGRQKLLREAHITLEIPPEKGLAMKADLALPWNKMREI